MVSGQLCMEEKIVTLRDKLFQICPRSKYRLIDPHITIVPPFSVDSEGESRIREIIDSYVEQKLEVVVEGVGVYPSLDNPRVVLLDVTASETVHQLREELVSFIAERDIEFRYEPTPFHVTLFKCDNGYTLADDRKQLLQNRVSSHRDSWSDMIDTLHLEEVI